MITKLNVYRLPPSERIAAFMCGAFCIAGITFSLIDLFVSWLISLLRCKRPAEPLLTEKVSLEEYEKEGEDYTKKQLDKLVQSEDYNKMLQQKGKDMTRWNWQTAERVERETEFKRGIPPVLDQSEDDNIGKSDEA